MRNITGDITNWVLRKKGNTVYYFDENGIYRNMPIEEVRDSKLKGWGIANDDSIFFLRPSNAVIRKDGNTIKKAVCMLKENDTIEDFERYLLQAKIEEHQKPQGVDRFITRIDKPIFIRTPENQKKNTFDFIYIDVNIVTQWNENKVQYIKTNMEEIKRRAIKKLEESVALKKYGVPINFLRITNISLKNNIIQFIFELKEI